MYLLWLEVAFVVVPIVQVPEQEWKSLLKDALRAPLFKDGSLFRTAKK